jgi:hypothetical protein
MSADIACPSRSERDYLDGSLLSDRQDPDPFHTGLPSGPVICFQLCSICPTTLSGIGT